MIDRYIFILTLLLLVVASYKALPYNVDEKSISLYEAILWIIGIGIGFYLFTIIYTLNKYPEQNLTQYNRFVYINLAIIIPIFLVYSFLKQNETYYDSKNKKWLDRRIPDTFYFLFALFGAIPFTIATMFIGQVQTYYPYSNIVNF
jgi:hypothetical protein